MSVYKMPLTDEMLKGKYRELHKLAVARFDIFEALKACKMMLNSVVDMDDALYYPLFITTVICYARPFTQNNIYGSLGNRWERFPNATLTGMHTQLIDARDQFVAHSDANARRTEIIPSGYSYPGVGRIVREHTLAVGRYAIALENFPIIKANCEYLISGLNRQIEDLLEELVVSLDLSNGPIQLYPLYCSE